MRIGSKTRAGAQAVQRDYLKGRAVVDFQLAGDDSRDIYKSPTTRNARQLVDRFAKARWPATA